MRASVVIPTYRRPALLARCLEALVRQEFDDYEIMVADDADSPETRRQVEALVAGAKVPIQYVAVAGQWPDPYDPPPWKGGGRGRVETGTRQWPGPLSGRGVHPPPAPSLPGRGIMRHPFASREGDHAGPAAARNAGWRAARGAVIAFTDDDTIPDPGWLAAAVPVFERDGDL